MVCDCLVFDLSWKKHLCLWGIYQLEGAWFLSSVSWGIYVLHKNNLDYWTRMTLKVLEVLGIDPSTSRMLSERSTIWATPPCWWLIIVWQRISNYFRLWFYIASIVKQLAKMITICTFTHSLNILYLFWTKFADIYLARYAKTILDRNTITFIKNKS